MPAPVYPKYPSRFPTLGVHRLPALMDANQLARYVDEHWERITGWTADGKDEEGEFSTAVLDLIDDNQVSYSDFVDAWTLVREGSFEEVL